MFESSGTSHESHAICSKHDTLLTLFSFFVILSLMLFVVDHVCFQTLDSNISKKTPILYVSVMSLKPSWIIFLARTLDTKRIYIYGKD